MEEKQEQGIVTDAPAAGRYEALQNLREPYLRRARRASELTVPSLIPPDGYDGSSDLYTPFQGIGADGVRTLSSKLTTTAFPANSPFFRMRPEEMVLLELKETNPEAFSKAEKDLGIFERMVMRQIEASGDRTAVDEGMKHLLVAGNICFDMTEEAMRAFKLDSYVVSRDPRGRVVEAVLREGTSPNALPKEVKDQVEGKLEGDDKNVWIYTHIKLVDRMYEVSQEIRGVKIAGTEARYKMTELPYIFLRFTRIDGEDYGRGFLEEVYGDLASYEALSRAIVEGAAAAAKVLFLIKANGTTRVKALIETQNLGFAEGNADDVTVLNVDKQADFRVAMELMRVIEERLSRQFMLFRSVQRNAERVTAEEVREVANELDVALSGIYSLLSIEFQKPYVLRKIKYLSKAKKLPTLPEGMAEPTILTGLDALGRSQDLQKLDLYIKGLAETFGPEEVAKVINLRVYATMRATALQLDMDGLIKTEEQIAQESQQAQLQGLAQQSGPGAIQELVKNGTDPRLEAQGGDQ